VFLFCRVRKVGVRGELALLACFKQSDGSS
jgi:hypothetical protein